MKSSYLHDENYERKLQNKTKGVETMRYRLKAACLALTVATLMLTAASVRAQDFGGQPIRMIVGLAAGGATDVTARLIAQKLSQSLGTAVIVENRPGASGNLLCIRIAKCSVNCWVSSADRSRAAEGSGGGSPGDASSVN